MHGGCQAGAGVVTVSGVGERKKNDGLQRSGRVAREKKDGDEVGTDVVTVSGRRWRD